MKFGFFRGVLQLALYAAITNAAWARSWVEVVDTTVYVSAMDDPYRETLKMEVDPIAYDSAASPSVVPTAAPVLDIVQAPTSNPTVSPTASPTQSVHTCPNDNEVLHLVRMHDAWGDGWGNSSIAIFKVNHTAVSNITTTYGIHSTMYSRHTSLKHNAEDIVLEASLGNGMDGYVYVCLEAGTCYDVEVSDSMWSNEIKWDIREASSIDGVAGSTLVKGLAPEHCQFSVQVKSTGVYVCPLICSSDEADASPAPSTNAPTLVPSVSPTVGIPTVKLTAAPTESKNSTNSSSTGNTPPIVPSVAPTIGLPTVKLPDPTTSPTTSNSTNSTRPTENSNFTLPAPSVAQGTEAPVLGIQGTPTASPRPTKVPTTPPTELTTAPPTVAETSSGSPWGGWTYGPTATWWPTATYWPTGTSYPTQPYGDDDRYFGDDDGQISSEDINANAAEEATLDTSTESPSFSPSTSLSPNQVTSPPTQEATRTVELGHEPVPTQSPTGGDAKLTESPNLFMAEGEEFALPSSNPSSSPSISAKPSETPSLIPSAAYRGVKLTENPSSNPSQAPSATGQPSDTPSGNPSVAYRGVRLTETPSQSSPPSLSGQPSVAPSHTSAPTNPYNGVRLTERPSRDPSNAPSFFALPSDAPSDTATVVEGRAILTNSPSSFPSASTQSSTPPSRTNDTLPPVLPTFLAQLLQVVPEESLTTGNRAPSSTPSSEPTTIQPQDREKIRKEYLNMLINGPQQ